MKKVVYIILIHLMASFSLLHAQSYEKTVRYNFPVWQGITDLDGSGMYSVLLKMVFETAGYKVIREPKGDIPWKKSIRNVQIGRSDTVGGEYSRLIKDRGMIHPKCPILMTNIYAVYRSKDFPKGIDPSKLLGKRVVENLGFQLSHILGFKDVTLLQAPNEHSTALMLLKNRADLILYEEYHYESASKKNPRLAGPDIKAEIYKTLQMFLMFRDTDKGIDLMDAWDNGLAKLQDEERLKEVKQLYLKYGLEYGMPDFDRCLK